MLSSSEIKHIAKLAKLRLDPSELDDLSADLSRVLDYVALLDQVEIEPLGEESTASSAVQRLREDRASESGLAVEQVLENAPESLDRFLLVPAIK